MTGAGSGEPLQEFLDVMRRLRAECPWKQEQTHRSLARYLLEETHETLEAIDTGDVEHLREELGDLLLQVFFHAVIAEQAGEFTLDDVARDISEKMRRRNPHVFDPSVGEAPQDAVAVNELWEAVKAEEKQRSSVAEGLPPGLPALLYADKVLDRLAREGREVSFGSHGGGGSEEGGDHEGGDHEGGDHGDVGDRLLALVAESRRQGRDPEQALRDAVRRLL